MADAAILARVLADFVQTVIRRYDVEEVVQQFCEHVAMILPVTGAGVCLGDDRGVLRFVAASDEEIVRVEHLQAELQEGPCMSTFRTGEPTVCHDLRSDPRWPRFADGAVEAGMIGVLGYPMTVDGRHIGALNAYCAGPLALSDEDLEAAKVLTAVGTGLVLNARDRGQARELNGQLQRALDSRVVIEQAKGALAERLDVSVNEAFAILRRFARGNGLPLRQVCLDVVAGDLQLHG